MDRYPDVCNPAYLVIASPGPPPVPELLYKAEQLVETRWPTLRHGVPKGRAEAELIQRAHWMSRGLSARWQPSPRDRGVSLTPTGRRATCYRLTTGGGGVVDCGTTMHLGGGGGRCWAANIYRGLYCFS